MNFFTGLVTIKLFNSLFHSVEHYTKDVVYWCGTNMDNSCQNQTKTEIYLWKEKEKVTI